MSADLLFELADGVALITLNRPQAMNAFEGAMREDLLARLQEVATDRAVRCVVITGVGNAFCTGGNIAGMAELQANDDVATIEQRMRTGGEVVRLMREMDKPVIAAVNGAAAGGGLNLALACDMRFAAPKARFSASFVKIGLVPDWGGHYLLTRMVGTARAMELMMSGERLDAEEALRLGLVNRVFPQDAFLNEVMSRAKQFAAGPREAIAAIKHGVYLGATGSLDDTLAFEQLTQAQLFLGADAREGMRAFLDKRPARFGQDQE